MARILFVEDDHSLRELATIALMRAGHDVYSARDAKNAFIQLLQMPFDALIVDIGLPDMDGLTMVRSLRASEKFKSLPILAATGFASKAHVDDMLAAGFDGIMEKPYRPRELAHAASELLRVCMAA